LWSLREELPVSYAVELRSGTVQLFTTTAFDRMNRMNGLDEQEGASSCQSKPFILFIL
jgi:hypothetical protein